MRVTLLTGLGAALGLCATIANANVVCNIKQDIRVPAATTIQDLQDTSRSCIERICTTGIEDAKDEDIVTDQCGPIVLSITSPSHTGLSDTENCSAHLTNIVDQCIATKHSQGGTIVTGKAIFEVCVASVEKSVGQRRCKSEKENGPPTPRVQYLGAEISRRKIPPKKPQPKASPKTSQPNVNQKGPKADAKPKKPQPKTTPKGSQPKKDLCGKAKGGKAKGGKNRIRNIIEGFLPEFLVKRAPPAGESCPISSQIQYYQKVSLVQNKDFQHHRFQTPDQGWKTAGLDAKAVGVLTAMKVNGKLDVVVMRDSKSYCIGKPDGKAGQNPLTVVEEAKAKSKSCLITNGAYFVMAGARNTELQLGSPIIDPKPLAGHTVGFTTEGKWIEEPGVHVEFYETFVADDGSSFRCGPPLKNELDLEHDERLQFWCKKHPGTSKDANPHPTKPDVVQTIDSQLFGGIATASDPNERLVVVLMAGNNLRLIVTYTGARQNGVNLNEMRQVVLAFMKQYLNFDKEKSPDGIKQFLNLDGGGSIFVAWLKEGKMKLISAGGFNGKSPERGSKFRPVATMVKFEAGPHDGPNESSGGKSKRPLTPPQQPPAKKPQAGKRRSNFRRTIRRRI